jgi:hypothetical protein
MFVHGKIPDKNAAGSNYLGEYVPQMQVRKAEAHYGRIEEKSRRSGQAEHHGCFFVSRRRPECDPVVQVVIETNAYQVTDNGGSNRLQSERLDE